MERDDKKMSLKAIYWFTVWSFSVVALAIYSGVYKFWNVDRGGAYFLMLPGTIALLTSVYFLLHYKSFWGKQ